MSEKIPNDEDAPIFGHPKGNPHIEMQGYEVYTFESDASDIVPDVFVVEYPDDPAEPYSRLWVAFGQGPFAVLHHYEQHLWAPDAPVGNEEPSCCSSLEESFTIDDVPTAVHDIILEVTDAPVMGPRSPTEDDD